MQTLKPLFGAVLCLMALTALLCPLPARADLIKSGAVYNRTVLMTSTADHITGLTGLTTFTVTLSKAGGTAATITPTVTEIGGGRYSVALATGNTGTLGALDMTITATGADPADTHDQVVGFDPTDGSLLGLSGVGTLANQAAIIAKTSLVATNGMDSPNEVTAQGNTGTILTQSGTILAQTSSTVRQADVTASLTGTPFITLPGAATTSGTGMVLTYKQVQALIDSVSGGDNATSGPPVASGTATVTYYLRGQAHSSSTITEVATVTYDANKQQVSRTVKVAQPFPAVN